MTSVSRFTFPFLGLTLLFGLTACATLPGQGPSTTAFTTGAADERGFELVEVDASVLSILDSVSAPALSFGPGAGREGPSPTISAGDTVSVAVFEAGSSGLFGGGGDASASSASTSSGVIPLQSVGSDGSITVPYAGRVRVAGLSQSQAEDRIRNALEGRAVQPQVLVSVQEQTGSSVTVVGEVTASGRIPLSQAGDRVLDVIASAGGVRVAVEDAMVNLTRQGATASVPMHVMVLNPSENVFVRSGDTITVTEEPATFLAAGATGRNAEVPFGSETLTVQQAIARSGGLIDSRADPSGVFLLRLENPEVVRRLMPNSPLLAGGGHVPVAYRFNMRDPYNLFLAGVMHVQHQDVLFVTNSAFSEFSKLTRLFTAAASPVTTTAGFVN